MPPAYTPEKGMVSSALLLDESSLGNVLTVAGFIAPASRLGEIANSWRDLKESTFGIDPGFELKYTFDPGHPCRIALDDRGWPHAERVPAMLDRVRDLGVILLADTMVDKRAETEPRDFYLDGLKWCCRRFAYEVGEGSGSHSVIVDMPSPPESMDGREVGQRLKDLWFDVGVAAFENYQRWYQEEEEFGEGRVDAPLRDFGFAPMLAASHAKHSDLLQIADVVAGSVRDLCWYNFKNASGGTLESATWREENFARIAPSFRRGGEGMTRYGFDILPKPHATRDALIARIEQLA
jgi:hypothetical protein